jgi:hypothetical protein
MRFRTLCSLLAASVSLAGSAAAQTSGPPGTPPAPGAPLVTYYPLYGGTLGISIPAGRLGDNHAAGYAIGGLVEFAVPNQPYALRGEASFQRFPLKSGREGSDISVLSVGPTVLYQVQMTPTQTYLLGGIAIYHSTEEEVTVNTPGGSSGTTVTLPGGTRPGFNFGAGIGFPLTGFSAIAEARLHVMLSEGKPILTLPLTVGVRF